MPPLSIKWFSRWFLASVILASAIAALKYPELKSQLIRQEPGAASLGDGVLILAVAMGQAVMLVLWFLVAHRASNIAKWVLVALTVVGFALMLPDLRPSMALLPVLTLLNAASQLIAIALLFRADAREWLGREQSPDLADIG